MWWSERRHWLVAAGALALAGCGFELRRPTALNFRTIALTGFPPRSSLAEELKRALVRGNVDVLDKPAEAQVVLKALSDERGKSVVASTSAAQVREFTLRLKFSFSAATPVGRELIAPAELLLSRDLTYSENFALAKQQEEDDLFREMQSDVVLQVIRRLASVRL